MYSFGRRGAALRRPSSEGAPRPHVARVAHPGPECVRLVAVVQLQGPGRATRLAELGGWPVRLSQSPQDSLVVVLAVAADRLQVVASPAVPCEILASGGIGLSTVGAPAADGQLVVDEQPHMHSLQSLGARSFLYHPADCNLCYRAAQSVLRLLALRAAPQAGATRDYVVRRRPARRSP